MDTLIEFEAPREAPLPWVWWRAPHEAQKIKFWDIILLFEAPRPWGASWDDSNTTKWGTSRGARVRGTSQICMVLHNIMRCLILCISLQEPNKIKNEVPQKHGITVMPCLCLTWCRGNFGPNCLASLFCKRGASFLSLDRSSVWIRVRGGTLERVLLSRRELDPRHDPVMIFDTIGSASILLWSVFMGGQ